MTHDNLLGRYRAYLTLEWAMADNTLEAYCRETARLLDYLDEHADRKSTRLNSSHS